MSETEPRNVLYAFGESPAPPPRQQPTPVLQFLSGQQVPLTSLGDAIDLLALLKVEFDTMERVRCKRHNLDVQLVHVIKQAAGEALANVEVPITPAEAHAAGARMERYTALAWACGQVVDAINAVTAEALPEEKPSAP